MPFGVGEALGVVGLTLQCLHGCIAALTLLSKARHYDQDVSNIRLQIELEQHFLFTWAEAAGLTQEPPELHVIASDAVFVLEILRQLDDLLSDLDKLKKRYGLDLKSISEDIEGADDHNSALSKLGPRARESVDRANASIFGRRTSPWKKLRWVTIDDRKVDKLLDVVKSYTSQLEKFLEPLKRAERGVDLDGVLRDAVLNVDDCQKLDIIGRGCHQASLQTAIAAAARLKQTRLKLGFSDSTPAAASSSLLGGIAGKAAIQQSSSIRPSSSQSSSYTFTNMRLSMRSLTLSRGGKAHVFRTLAYYEKRVVLLEWKRKGDLDPDALKKRTNQVATFLHHIEPSFHSLPCLGYVNDHESSRFGYIFDLPGAFQITRQPKQTPRNQPLLPALPSLQSLQDLFYRPLIPPSLNDRMSIAVILLETLLNLHTSGWLHKEFRSDNIILIRDASDTKDRVEYLTAYSIHVAGYVSARTDLPGEMTELPMSEKAADLYRHPLSLGKSRKPFRKSFDIFSVGCTLLEIGLWLSLPQILEQHAEWSLPSKLQTLPHPESNQNSSCRSSFTGTAATNPIEINGKAHDDTTPVIDFMKLRHELLLSQLPNLNVDGDRARPRCRILQSLEAATGSQYTGIVEGFLSTGADGHLGKDADDTEHEDALDMEVTARDTIYGIMKVI